MLPIFALFNPALGMTTIVPEIDPRRPAAADPAKIVQAIRQEQVTNSFGSPTLWRIVGRPLPGARGSPCRACAGSSAPGRPCPAALWTAAQDFLPDGRLHSPYGATEALPVSIDRAARRRRAAGGPPIAAPAWAGRCRESTCKIIALSRRPDRHAWRAPRSSPAGEIGEIIVRGPVVTRAYDRLPDATAAAKIADPSAATERLAPDGRLRLFRWRRPPLVLRPQGGARARRPAGTLFTEPCEQRLSRASAAPRAAP